MTASEKPPLQRLLEVGIGDYPMRDLPSAQAWCQSQQAATGDARFGAIEETLGDVVRKTESTDVLPYNVIVQLDELFAVNLPTILDETLDPGAATRRAEALRAEVNRAIDESPDW